jgi:hypothetical protein
MLWHYMEYYDPDIDEGEHGIDESRLEALGIAKTRGFDLLTQLTQDDVPGRSRSELAVRIEGRFDVETNLLTLTFSSDTASGSTNVPQAKMQMVLVPEIEVYSDRLGEGATATEELHVARRGGSRVITRVERGIETLHCKVTWTIASMGPGASSTTEPGADDGGGA